MCKRINKTMLDIARWLGILLLFGPLVVAYYLLP